MLNFLGQPYSPIQFYYKLSHRPERVLRIVVKPNTVAMETRRWFLCIADVQAFVNSTSTESVLFTVELNNLVTQKPPRLS